MAAESLLYRREEGSTRVQVRRANETMRLTQKHIALLFQTFILNINTHLRHIFEEGELNPESVIKHYLIAAADGKHYRAAHYNLEVIIAVGYRVRSHRGT